ncbi:MAG: hypothetical protein PHC61_14635 [Chitinivibrionales bacterium]|nr:hypothetical protein [Chitinivibrionales bacterium]
MRCCAILILALLAVGCSSRVPLTKGLIQDYRLSDNDIPKLQLYISDGILLEKRLTTIDKNIDSASFALKKVEDYFVKQVYFKKGTPCIAVSAAADKVAVAFEQPGDNLSFVARPHAPGTPFTYEPDKKFQRDSTEDRPAAAGFSKWKITGNETYNDTSYNVLIKNDLPYLLVDKTSLKNFTIVARKVKGLRQMEINAK